jgi:hypothetical protein
MRGTNLVPSCRRSVMGAPRRLGFLPLSIACHSAAEMTPACLSAQSAMAASRSAIMDPESGEPAG